MAIFTLGFWCYALDPVSVAAMLATWKVGHPVDFGLPGDRHAVQVILGSGAALTVLAALLRTWSAAYLRSKVVHDFKEHSEALVADGPFRYTRNPLYLGGLLFAVGLAMSASRLGFVVIMAGVIVLFLRLIGREESLLRETQGESYRLYLNSVPRLLPSLTPRVAAGGIAPEWGQALVGETFMWFFALAAVSFAVNLNRRLFVTLMVCGIAASILVKAVQKSSEGGSK